MATLFLDRREAVIESAAGALLVRGGDGALARAPLALAERVVLRGPARISTGAIAAIAEAGAALLVLSGRHGRPAAAMLGRAHADAAIRIGQFRLALDGAARVRIAALLLRRKLAGQRRLLGRALQRRPDRRLPLRRGLEALAEAQHRLRRLAAEGASPARLMGVEGAAAAAYFEAFAAILPPALGFAGRNRRPPRDPVNAALSLAYTLGHFEAVREAHLAGLDPAVGFLHALAPGRESLACDLVEPLRPHLDHLVWRLFAEERLRGAHFTRDGAACLLGKAGRLAFYAAWEEAAAPLRRALRRGLRPLVRAARAAAAELCAESTADADGAAP
ncbi:CRISPR-associated endonuclease Cas1 [Caldovatus aquaticus]|uniref:CRISPR-associated endonuclease Cas1 n=1 Tax=Caldovatus aquaticus TaxID=2865671 RepID=A0ABS7F074_9PROT|nr:CRISPR-associated endonuclease Cas1 [Caldovatus aquaticus]MBW8269025.1 CRISPR-associated endonuclease Cas1 [Caldovatus aquaticus]